MYEEYDNLIKPDSLLIEDMSKLNNFENIHNETYIMCVSLQLRVSEFFESVEYWLLINDELTNFRNTDIIQLK